jgi:hypothetical protein
MEEIKKCIITQKSVRGATVDLSVRVDMSIVALIARVEVIFASVIIAVSKSKKILSANGVTQSVSNVAKLF